MEPKVTRCIKNPLALFFLYCWQLDKALASGTAGQLVSVQKGAKITRVELLPSQFSFLQSNVVSVNLLGRAQRGKVSAQKNFRSVSSLLRLSCSHVVPAEIFFTLQLFYTQLNEHG